MGNNQAGMQCHHCMRPSQQVNLKECKLCKQFTCSDCLNNPLVMEEDRETLKVSVLCRPCFKQNVSLDSKPIEILGEGYRNTIIWLHGGGSCRLMFEVHARFLEKKGYRSILMDLPGHGTLMDSKLTLENCLQTIQNVRKDHCKEPPILIGGSFGAYVIMELMKEYPRPDEYRAAVLMMCGQNVGDGRSWKASLGLWGLGKAVNLLSAETLVNGLTKAAKQVDRELLADLLRGGYYFHQGNEQIEILKNSSPEIGLARFEGPILFINGSEDHRDSQQRWLKASRHGQLKVYEGGNHFFSHDRRFIKQLQTDLLEFVEGVFKQTESKSSNEPSTELREKSPPANDD